MQWLKRFVDFLKRLFGNGPTPTVTTQRGNAPAETSSSPAPAAPASIIAPTLKLESDEPPVYRKTNSLLTFQERKFYYTAYCKRLAANIASIQKCALAI
jgi:hypothetical protein